MGLRRRLRQCKITQRNYQLLIAFFCIVLIFLYKLLVVNDDTGYSAGKKILYNYCKPIDVVYTWVNGSDPVFIAAAKQYDPDYDPARFDDKHELRYSLRSLEKYANWIRHVYIITNGQIPNWLDLSYERVTVVPHEVLAADPKLLPTFSSPAIETFIHRIPNLSKRFLYLNDDIFLGTPLYPEDLYTESEGVRIYQAWMVPDCATDCPWTYIGDGGCDKHCNIEACQYDGGDCNEPDPQELQSQEFQSTVPTVITNWIRMFPKHLLPLKLKRNNTNFRDILRHQNVSTLKELRSIVDGFNKQKLQSNEGTANPQNIEIVATANTNTFKPNLSHYYTLPKPDYKSSTDAYSHSLINTNMLLNRIYGFKARNVLAHVGFLLDRNIIDEMQQMFYHEVQETATQRFRAPTDLQFAFAYYSFLMSEIKTLTVAQIFDEYDTDDSGTWSDREVRTFLTRMYPPPLDWSAMHYFEEVVNNCSRHLGPDVTNDNIHPTLVYERYEDSNLPTITQNLVINCQLLAEAMQANFAQRPKYKYNINSKRTISNFMMLTSNVSDVIDGLDRLRRHPRKFNCINDNLDATHTENNLLIRHLLEDFYLSFFPQRSKYELAPQYRNRFVNWQDYQRWKRRKRGALVLGYGFSILLVFFICRFVFAHKAKLVRRCIQRL